MKNKVVDNKDVGQGQLYSPDYAIPVVTNTNHGDGEKKKTFSAGDVVATATTYTMKNINQKVMEKLLVETGINPNDASMDSAREFLEMINKEVGASTQGIIKHALHRLKTHLPQIILTPSLPPNQVSKMVDDAEREVAEEAAAGKKRNSTIFSSKL